MIARYNALDIGDFFSSGRRHPRWPRDWSSDLCSSDLRGRTPHSRSVLKTSVAAVTDVFSAGVLCGVLPLDHHAVRTVEALADRKRDDDPLPIGGGRSEERRVGKECRSRWARDNYTQ